MPYDIVMSAAGALTSMNSFLAEIAGWGYAGIFIVSVIGSASIIFPVPSMIFVFLLSGELNPIIIALLAGAGSAIGEMAGYGLGYGSSLLTEKKKRKWEKIIGRTKDAFQKHGGFWIIVLFAATPLPHDIVGIVAGTLKYHPKKFLFATFIGKFAINLVIALAGFYSINWVVDMLA